MQGQTDRVTSTQTLITMPTQRLHTGLHASSDWSAGGASNQLSRLRSAVSWFSATMTATQTTITLWCNFHCPPSLFSVLYRSLLCAFKNRKMLFHLNYRLGLLFFFGQFLDSGIGLLKETVWNNFQLFEACLYRQQAADWFLHQNKCHGA